MGVINARFVKPLDRALLLSHAACIPLLVTMEDHVLAGGFGSAILEALQSHGVDLVLLLGYMKLLGPRTTAA